MQQHLDNRLLGLADYCMFCPVNGTILSKHQPRPGVLKLFAARPPLAMPTKFAPHPNTR